MKRISYLLCLMTIGLLASCAEELTVQPVPFNEVELKDGFWKERMKTELEVTVPFSVEQSAPAVERFRQCIDYMAGNIAEPPVPHRFISSDLYKVMEGVAYSLMQEENPELEAFMDSTIALIAEAQQPDGYLYITHTCGNPTPNVMGNDPYSFVVHSHELYNVGHLYEAAIAYYQATGKRQLLDVAIKNADHVNRVFFEGGDPAYNGGAAINQAPGHQEIELALCKLYRVTGEQKYLDMAKRFLDIRGVTYMPEGKGVMSPTYAQQHLPVAQQTEAVGHAVRAAYMYTAMAQVDALTGRDDYKVALDAIWNNLVCTRMHITGGLGATQGIEGFGPEYYLPNKTAYNETCAAVSNVFFNQGLFLAEKDGKYLDVLELSLYNNALAGISLSGDKFFYVNPLESDGVRRFNHGHGGRADWFACACCPPNISRLILQVAGYMYAYSEKEIYLTLYGDSRTSIPMKGTSVKIDESSAYPFDGNVRVELSVEKPVKFDMKMRIPTWCGQTDFVPGGLYKYEEDRVAVMPEIKVNGEAVGYTVDKGFAVVSRKWSNGDVIELELPMETLYVTCDERVEDNVGLKAVVRGPLVYCAEEIDNGCPIQTLALTNGASTESVIEEGVLKGLVQISLPGVREDENGKADVIVNMVPYYSWDNRGDNKTMKVWLKDGMAQADAQTEGLLSTAELVKCVGKDFNHADANLTCLVDGTLPASSSEKTAKVWKAESADDCVVLTFKENTNVASISVYWMTAEGCAVPAGWNIEYMKDGKWNQMNLYVTDSYGVAENRLNVVHPDAEMKCDAIKVNVKSAAVPASISEIVIETESAE